MMSNNYFRIPGLLIALSACFIISCNQAGKNNAKTNKNSDTLIKEKNDTFTIASKPPIINIVDTVSTKKTLLIISDSANTEVSRNPIGNIPLFIGGQKTSTAHGTFWHICKAHKANAQKPTLQKSQNLQTHKGKSDKS